MVVEPPQAEAPELNRKRQAKHRNMVAFG